MFVQPITALMIASLLTAQATAPDAPAAPPAPQNSPATVIPNSAEPKSKAITLPTGTSIPLTLMTVIKSKSTKPGDMVRAVVAFPVTEGTQLAIPAGTYVEGVVNQVTAKPLSNQQPIFRVHFDRLLFLNGYSVALSGENTQALLMTPDRSVPANEVAELMPIGLPEGSFAQIQTPLPTLPPPQQVGPNPAVIGGIVGGVMAATIIGSLVWMHHRANNYDYAVFDTGWQFQMVLDSPVSLDAAQVAAAAAMAAPNGN